MSTIIGILLFAIASLLSAQDMPTEAKIPALQQFVKGWGRTPKYWFLAIEVPGATKDDPPYFSEPPGDLLQLVQTIWPNVLPLSESEPCPKEFPAVIHRKGSNTEGVYLRIGTPVPLKNGRFRLMISGYAGSHYGGGTWFIIGKRKQRWAVIRTDGGVDY